MFAWTDNANPSSGTVDLALARNASGILEINNGTAGTLRDLSLRSMTASGSAIKMTGLATADPHVVGQLWNNSGVLTVSAG